MYMLPSSHDVIHTSFAGAVDASSFTVPPESNILVVGLIGNVKDTQNLTETTRRDTSRINALKETFSTVFSLASEAPKDCQPDPVHHVGHKMNHHGAKALVQLMDSRHAGKKLDYICLEYERVPKKMQRNRAICCGTAKGIEWRVQEKRIKNRTLFTAAAASTSTGNAQRACDA